ncbi:MAG: hypothetical protein ORN24_04655, partial [Burkholderiales bacterium]|nr:hypothetical protein [Burkholderiales bacterium]
IFVFVLFNATASEVTVTSCQLTGHFIYSQCIAITPITTEQLDSCVATYATYTICLQIINNPYPLTPVIYSKYHSNPFDICKYETGTLIMVELC